MVKSIILYNKKGQREISKRTFSRRERKEGRKKNSKNKFHPTVCFLRFRFSFSLSFSIVIMSSALETNSRALAASSKLHIPFENCFHLSLIYLEGHFRQLSRKLLSKTGFDALTLYLVVAFNGEPSD